MIPDGLQLPPAPFDLLASAHVLAKRGSEAHGTYVPPEDPVGHDDRDVLLVCVPPPAQHFGIGFPNFELKRWEQVQGICGVWDTAAYELRRFAHLLCRQNPSALQALWLEREDYYYLSPLGESLVAHRDLFRARRPLYEATVGYARAQVGKMLSGVGDPKRGFMGEKRKELRERYGYDTKNAAHAVRILETGRDFLRTGEMVVRRPPTCVERLLQIKRGEWSLVAVVKLIDGLFAAAENEYATSRVPEAVNLERVNEWLVDWTYWAIRRQA